MSKRKTFILFSLVFAIASLFLVGEVMATLEYCSEIQDGKKGDWYRICLLKAGEETTCWDPGPDGTRGTADDGPDFKCFEWRIEACKLDGQGGTCTDAVPQQLNMPFCDCNPGKAIEIYDWMSHSDFKQAVGTGPAEDYIKNCEWWQFTFSSGSTEYSVFTNTSNALNGVLDLKINSEWYPQVLAWASCPSVADPVTISSETHEDNHGNSITCSYDSLGNSLGCVDQNGELYNSYSLTDFDMVCNIIDPDSEEVEYGPFTIRFYEGFCPFDIDPGQPGAGTRGIQYLPLR